MVAAVLLGMAIAPVSGLRPFFFQIYSTVADRYAYVALLAPALAGAALLAGRTQRALYMAAAAALLGLALLSYRQTTVWTDTFSWTSYIIEHQPTSTIAHSARASLLHVYGRNAEALDEVDIALRYAPGRARYEHIRAEILMDLDRPADAAAAVLGLIERSPAYRDAYGLLVDAAEKAGNPALAIAAWTTC